MVVLDHVAQVQERAVRRRTRGPEHRRPRSAARPARGSSAARTIGSRCQPSARAARTTTTTAAIPSDAGAPDRWSDRTSPRARPSRQHLPSHDSSSVAPTTLCWVGDEYLRTIRVADRPGGRIRRHHRAPTPRCAGSCTACRASTRSAPRPGPRSLGHPVDQDHRQGVRDRPRHPDGRPDHARGPGHPRQGARAGRQGDAPRPGRPDLPVGRRRLRLPRHGRRPPRRRSATSGVNVAAVATAFPSGRAAMDIKLADTRDAVEAGADEIDMVIDRGAFLSGRYLQVFEEIVAVTRGLRGRRAPQGDLRDRRAADLRQRPPRLAGWR